MSRLFKFAQKVVRKTPVTVSFFGDSITDVDRFPVGTVAPRAGRLITHRCFNGWHAENGSIRT